LGFFVIAIIQFIFTIPIIGFPREFPNSAEIRKNKEVHSAYGSVLFKPSNEGEEQEKVTFHDLKSGFFHLLTNPLYMSLVVASTASAFFIITLAMFGPKLSQILFSVSSKEAALLCASVVFPTSLLAVLLGGLIPKFFKFNIKDLFVSCLVGSGICFVLGFALLFPCDRETKVDVTDAYYYKGSLCNVTECNCDPYVFDPYCVDQEVSLYNPCYYGCVDEKLENCGCYDDSINTSLEPGNCEDDDHCSRTLFLLFGSVLATMCFIAFYVFPATTALIDRVVIPEYRSFGFGFALFTLRLLGTTPAPLITGVIFDQSCEFKPENDDAIRSSCASYSSLNQSFGVVAIFCCGFSALVLAIGYIFLRISESDKEDNERSYLIDEKNGKPVKDMGKLLDEIMES